jgi:transcriptional regulator of acetoin/glycerol metabolism
MAIRKSLEMANGNKSKAAKLFGIGRATLYRKLKDLG